MNNTLDIVKLKLEQLYEILLEISPLSEDIFFNSYSSQLIDTLSSLIERASTERSSIRKENEGTIEMIREYCEELEIDTPELPSLENILLEREMLNNELGRIRVIKNAMEGEIERLKKEIGTLKKDLFTGDDSSCNSITNNNISNNNSNGNSIPNNNISNNNSITNNNDNNISNNSSNGRVTLPKIIEELKYEKNLLLNEISKLESKREFFYQEILSYRAKLYNTYEIPIKNEYSEKTVKVEPFPDFTYEEKILDLKRLLDSTIQEYDSRKALFDTLLGEIRRKESILGIENKPFDYLYIETIETMKSYEEHLKREQERLFDKIFENTMAQLSDIRLILGKRLTNYPRTERGLMEMRAELEKLLPMREIYIEIKEKINKRKNLLDKMTEFEKIASDPKRLFKSSFQLNSEEKFRNNAYPSLLKMEESILELIEKFEKNYGTFEYNGEEYKTALKYEIENRIINRTVFISRCDSPFRKKK